VLETISDAPYSITPVKFESNVDSTGSVYFLEKSGTKGLFSFTSKGFLAYDGDAEHWTQCLGPLEQDVVRRRPAIGRTCAVRCADCPGRSISTERTRAVRGCTSSINQRRRHLSERVVPVSYVHCTGSADTHRKHE
jgi:hypothetical protein